MTKLRRLIQTNLKGKHPSARWRLFAPIMVLLLPLLVLGGNVSNASVPTPNQSASAQTLVMRVYFHDNAERDRLANEYNAEEVATTGGYLTVFGDQAMYDSIVAQGIRVEIDQAETKAFNSVKWNSDTFFGGFRTVEEEGTYLNQMAATYPTLAQVVDIGDSWCKVHTGTCTEPNAYNGYDILALHITNQAIAGPKPVFWYDSGIHAREIATPEIAMTYISYLLDGYNSDPDAHWLVDYQDIWVVPMLNPDGHHIVESGGGGNSPYYQRKNSNNTNGCTDWPPSAFSQFGTDNNRNFPFMWNCCGGSSSAPCDQTYHGTTGNSDPETQAEINQIRLLIPDQRGPNITDPAPITTTGVVQGMHSNASLDLYPWGFSTDPAPNTAELANIGAHMSAANAYPSGNSYQSCQPPICLYAVDGDSLDWAYGELGAAAFTTEVGGNDFFVPISYVNNTLWPANRGALVYQAKIARTPYLLAHGPDAANVATIPMTVTQGVPSVLSGTINFMWSGDAFSQNVGAAEYYIDTPPWAGGTGIPMTGNFNSARVQVQATVDTSSLSVGRHILFVRGRGATDFDGYQTWGAVSAAWLWVLQGGTATPTVTGTPPTVTPTPSSTNTPTATPTACGSAIISNGGFETGALPPWVVLGTNPPPVVSSAAHHTGSYSVLVGAVSGPEPSGDGSIYQTITVPAGGGMLSYWWYGGTSDTITFDWQDAYVTSTSGTILATIMHNCETTDDWTNVTFDMTPYAGQTVRIEFLVHEDGAVDDTYMYVDDVQLITACSTTTPGSTSTNTPVSTSTAQPTNTVPAATNTAQAGTATSTVPAPTNTSSVATATTVPPVATETPTACTLSFRDVPVGSTFYPFIRCLACKGIINGYPDGTFRPGNNVTRGQLSKIVSNSAGFSDNQTTQMFQDVPVGSTFYQYIGRLASRGFINGYPCGAPPAGQCVPPATYPTSCPTLTPQGDRYRR